MTNSDERHAIEALLADMAAALREARFDALDHVFHEEVVIATAEVPEGLIVGRETVIEVYKAFVTGVKITEYQEEPPWVRVWGDAASAGFAWVLAWEDSDGAHAVYGQDIYALSKGPQGWRIVNRLLIEGGGEQGALTGWSEARAA